MIGMISLDSPKWSDLRHAYGTAEDLPDLLRRLYADPTDKNALDLTWGRLCHQGTIYSASIAAAPHLVSLAANLHLQDRLEPLIMVGAIAESLGRSSQTLAADADFQECRAKAIELLTESIKYSGLMNHELRHSLSALAALLGDSKLASLLSSADCGIQCPECGTEIDLLESSLVE